MIQDLEVTIMTLYMVCPYCNKVETNVFDSRKNNEGNSIRRRRECPKCELRFTTYEKAEIGLLIQKRSGDIPVSYTHLTLPTIFRV